MSRFHIRGHCFHYANNVSSNVLNLPGAHKIGCIEQAEFDMFVFDPLMEPGDQREIGWIGRKLPKDCYLAIGSYFMLDMEIGEIKCRVKELLASPLFLNFRHRITAARNHLPLAVEYL